MRRHNAMAGFTIIELMVVVMVTAVLLTIAVPGFENLFRSSRAAAQSGYFFNALNYARSEAVKRAATVGVRISGGTDWAGGWFVWADANGNNVYDAGTDPILQQFSRFSGKATLTSTGQTVTEVTFDSQGAASAANGTTTVNLPITFHYSPGSTDCQDISVNMVGRIYMAKATTCP